MRYMYVGDTKSRVHVGDSKSEDAEHSFYIGFISHVGLSISYVGLGNI